MDEKRKVVRIPFNIYRNNPEHEQVYAILEKQENKSAYIRDAVLNYYAQGKSGGSSVSKEEIREIVREVGEELVEVLVARVAESASNVVIAENCKSAKAPERKQIDFEKLKKLF